MFQRPRFRISPLCAITLSAGLLAFAPPALAQTSNGQIIGVVTDPTGAVIPDAAITVTNTQTNVKTVIQSDRSGSFKALSLQIGTYKVTAEKAGFSLATSPEYTIGINQTQKVDFKLALPGSNQSIEVTVDSAALDTVSATIGGSVTERPLVDLPLNGRNILDLAQLQPGVVNAVNPGNTSAGSVSIAGGRTDSVTYLLDGGNNTSLLNNGVVFNRTRTR